MVIVVVVVVVSVGIFLSAVRRHFGNIFDNTNKSCICISQAQQIRVAI